MTREEAIDRLKTEVKRIEEIMENGEVGCVDMDTWNEFAKKAEWRETLIELLSVPTPDPITGLVPCGCGCKPELRDDVWGWHQVYCTGCDMHGGNSHTPDGVIEEWNTAMGWKGGTE